VTLTGELDRTGSVAYLWAREHLPGSRALSAALRGELGRDPTAVVPAPAQPYPAGFEAGRQATAHEFRLQMSLMRPDLASARLMTSRLPRQHADPVLEALAVLDAFLDEVSPWDRTNGWLLDDDVEEWLARACWLLAQLEAARRRGMHDRAGPLYAGHSGGRAVLAAATTDSVMDLMALARAAANGRFANYRAVRSADIVAGPTPSGTRDVGGADGDLLIDRCLVEVKTVGSLARIRRQDLLQIALYVLLDYDDHLAIEQVALYLGRHALLVTWDVRDYLSILSGKPANVSALRANLREALQNS
jgi:hypothetical protein